MTEVQAKAEIRMLCEGDTAPTLSGTELAFLVRQAKRADSVRRPPSDAAWEPTWNIPFAVGKGWRLKAGKLAGKYDFKSGSKTFNRSQMRAHCLSQAAEWERQAAESVTLLGGWRRRVISGETNGILEEDLEYQ